jgi:hypothetical protein
MYGEITDSTIITCFSNKFLFAPHCKACSLTQILNNFCTDSSFKVICKHKKATASFLWVETFFSADSSSILWHLNAKMKNAWNEEKDIKLARLPLINKHERPSSERRVKWLIRVKSFLFKSRGYTNAFYFDLIFFSVEKQIFFEKKKQKLIKILTWSHCSQKIITFSYRFGPPA